MDVTRGAKSAKWHAGSSSGKTTKSHGTVNVFDKVQGSSDDIAKAAELPPEDMPGLCDENCEKELAKAWVLKLVKALVLQLVFRYEGGRGELPTVVGFWPTLTCSISNIVCLSLEKGQLYIFRVGSDQVSVIVYESNGGLVIKGLGEGILSMKVGGKRRLYIPGPVFKHSLPVPFGPAQVSCRIEWRFTRSIRLT
ncbi:hypothetical protein SADUNF_Sadunf07G0116000 [Salix dunnii]|uniref:Rotamase n=1 Tax=Salix dunnii TaxID=1413687 RepID=A0A835MUC8_9ROSI|nr:hypothetical protein SADUNF_Sadunf07G0116000 [Salix dunnii]